MQKQALYIPQKIKREELSKSQKKFKADLETQGETQGGKEIFEILMSHISSPIPTACLIILCFIFDGTQNSSHDMTDIIRAEPLFPGKAPWLRR